MIQGRNYIDKLCCANILIKFLCHRQGIFMTDKKMYLSKVIFYKEILYKPQKCQVDERETLLKYWQNKVRLHWEYPETISPPVLLLSDGNEWLVFLVSLTVEKQHNVFLKVST
jgi:hypothetical protein